MKLWACEALLHPMGSGVPRQCYVHLIRQVCALFSEVRFISHRSHACGITSWIARACRFLSVPPFCLAYDPKSCQIRKPWDSNLFPFLVESWSVVLPRANCKRFSNLGRLWVFSMRYSPTNHLGLKLF